MGVVRKKGALPKRTLSPADETDAQALEHAVKTMIEGPLSAWDHSRPLSSLNRSDLSKLASAAITGWVLKRAELGEWRDTDPLSAALAVE